MQAIPACSIFRFCENSCITVNMPSPKAIWGSTPHAIRHGQRQQQKTQQRLTTTPAIGTALWAEMNAALPVARPDIDDVAPPAFLAPTQPDGVLVSYRSTTAVDIHSDSSCHDGPCALCADAAARIPCQKGHTQPHPHRRGRPRRDAGWAAGTPRHPGAHRSAGRHHGELVRPHPHLLPEPRAASELTVLPQHQSGSQGAEPAKPHLSPGMSINSPSLVLLASRASRAA